jgi:tetratricopeptide (TPR) repeat protein
MLIPRAAFFTFGVWLLLVSPTAAFHDEAPVRAGMLRASDQILNLDLDPAEATCRELLTLPSGKAAGHFCLGLVALAKAEDRDDPAPELDRFMEHATAALAAGESLERTAPSDAEVKLLLGLIHGSRALVEGERRNYLSALQDVREAHRRFEEALQLDAGLVDASYGLGVYNLAMGRLPGILRPLATIVLPNGDTEQGLEMLEQVADDGPGRPAPGLRRTGSKVRRGLPAGGRSPPPVPRKP